MTDESLTYRLLRLVHAMDDATNDGIRDVMAELGLTHALADALWQLDPDAQPPTMREMATRLRCDPSTVTFLADRLEQLSFVSRAPAPHDRRTKVLALTAAGRNARQRLVKAATTGTPIAALTRAEQLTLHDLLTKAMTAAGAT
ncbi:MarR family transcriptional regulator [Actinoplanes sp. Pm04-4]|uniref:MarR family transcriptional regulator n=1 Tax=Paractinoplanes pyxinae TaxID=2997416 RepID=A0ABT4B988_9ACTN|nr:MarR family transcriptional regulator [Actinoplanes pyxinae]MCY1143078.1 MarR family transcriptional regulator [Actinoplanes pyxinae]